MRPRVIAIDWSGRERGQRRFIYLAEASGRHVQRLENGRTRTEIVGLLVKEAERDRALVVGLDFGFSLPAWFLHDCGLSRATELWSALGRDGERWLRDPPHPFWRSADPRLDPPERAFRETEREIAELGLGRPMSVFKLVGAGHVGTGSIRGMALLPELVSAGFHVWPFTSGDPLIVEIYPRALLFEGRQLLEDFEIDREMQAAADASDDARDALLSALVMSRYSDRFASLEAATRGSPFALEGRIWHPGIRPDGSLDSGT